MQKHKGFGIIGIILILLLIGLLGFGGWYVWNNSSEEEAATPETSTSAESEDATEPEPDPTADWVEYSSEEGQFSFKHPADWALANNLEQCTDSLVLLGANEDVTGLCASESGGQMQVSSTDGDVRANYQFDEDYYIDTTDEAVTVEGVAGNKLSATVSDMDGEVFVGALPDGTELTRYLFFTGGKTYIASYTQQPTYPNALSDFNLLATETLKFSP